ncbi:MAG: cytidylate kinase-like family protein [Clostridia bacterium]|nr:cytidylate kinase-like family protein [Clostridia bacterium]MBO7156623.1 cytidylate kinase-like family protein [Clostridia bacterium]
MKLITISREFGSGGREFGKRLADFLGYDYYDREIITSIAENKGYSAEYVENSLESRNNLILNYGTSFVSTQVDVRTELLIEEKRVLDTIAKRGRNAVIVGRNADVILEEYNPFTIFVCADREAKIERCMSREKGSLTRREIIANIRKIDKSRARTRALMTGAEWGDVHSYNLTINTTDKDIKELAKAVARYLDAN